MKALITGASSGIGKDMAFYLSNLGHEVILVSRDKEALENVKKALPPKSQSSPDVKDNIAASCIVDTT